MQVNNLHDGKWDTGLFEQSLLRRHPNQKGSGISVGRNKIDMGYHSVRMRIRPDDFGQLNFLSRTVFQKAFPPN